MAATPMARGTCRLLLAGLALRLALVLYGDVQDRASRVKYTDIDYVVFTDAAALVARGGSPFGRATYRYSPLLAYVLLPNVWISRFWGKLLFSACDVLAGWMIADTLAALGAQGGTVDAAVAGWLFNPFTFAISTRGSCDVLVVVMLLALLRCLLSGRRTAAAVLFGLAVHFRIYPIIYGPSVLLYLSERQRRLDALRLRLRLQRPRPQHWPGLATGDSADAAHGDKEDEQQHGVAAAGGEDEGATAGECGGGTGDGNGGTGPGTGGVGDGTGTSGDGGRRRHDVGAAGRRADAVGGWRDVLVGALRQAVPFGLVSGSTFLLLGAVFWRAYGWQFLHEAFLHHLTRRDPRHNFSPHWYPTYLTFAPEPQPGSSPLGSEAAGSSGGGSGSSGSGGNAAGMAAAWWLSPGRWAFVPVAVLVPALSWRLRTDLPLCWALLAMAFVAFNKVCTAQYFVWYMSLLPLALPSIKWPPPMPLLLAVGAWVAAQLHWLAWAYQLEFQGRAVHLELWGASILFQAAGAVLMAGLLAAVRPDRPAFFITVLQPQPQLQPQAGPPVRPVAGSDLAGGDGGHKGTPDRDAATAGSGAD